MADSYFGKNLKYLRTKNKLEQRDIANLLNKKSVGTISYWEQGKSEPKHEILNFLADYFEVSVNDLLNSDLANKKRTVNIGDLFRRLTRENKIKATTYVQQLLQNQSDELAARRQAKQLFKIPVYQHIAAGLGWGKEQVDGVVDYFYVEEEPPKFDFAMIVEGDSMEPEFHNGEIALFRKASQVDDGGIYAVDYQKHNYLKKVYQDDEATRLVSINPAYQDIVIPVPDYEDVSYEDIPYVIGKVIASYPTVDQ
ncbi:MULTISPECIES: XRE family transcriptional regulator [unclassified Enterococcus]|uniref:XRE family transcriptional regulator n=1 Tax=unclassified Enterococcus TaxID=2608891 RepID=UPI001554A9DD|nr:MULTISPECIES: XRE family transcriptional regulator [unclassified Enterococcus]MBS7578203.1 LexA family transcriptional regulator [Enterococcus sp. MMGLQ5-2]MBS7585421.1 LexA family transcriptional regulator [Enterococcus sp. MMGLQ5-1]NPD13278.1 LexA family transcriptional regulator [Enterococcus sp. MMGLQ5-1]NPD38034.1 LexA family transcriptional regulator [Enterococcus sp. MMGLQ5-2]